MTTFRGIAVVTETLRYLLTQAAAAVPNAQVRIGHPEGVTPGGEPMMNIFLYQAQPITELRNADLPIRGPRGQFGLDPTLAVELDYLVSFAGADNTTESELLIGAAISALRTTPIIDESLVAEALRASGAVTLDAGDIRGPAQITPLSLTAAERSSLWSLFVQVPYRLSVEYRVRAVLVSDDLDGTQPSVPLPVSGPPE